MTADVERLETLRSRVQSSELELRDAVEELERTARRTLDPREWIRVRPLVWVGAASALGFYLGGRR